MCSQHLGFIAACQWPWRPKGHLAGMDSSSASFPGWRLSLCKWSPNGGREKRTLVLLGQFRREGLPLLLEFVKNQYVTTYVLQLPEVSDKSLETPLFVSFFFLPSRLGSQLLPLVCRCPKAGISLSFKLEASGEAGTPPVGQDGMDGQAVGRLPSWP